MYQINHKEFLTKVTEYILHREKLSIKICIHEIIAGESKTTNFQAIPTGSDGIASKEYCGFGDSEPEALEKCLEQIKNVDDETILKWFIKPLYAENEK